MLTQQQQQQHRWISSSSQRSQLYLHLHRCAHAQGSLPSRPQARPPSQAALRSAMQQQQQQQQQRLHASRNSFNAFTDTTLERSTISIVGDLHLAPEQMHLFNQARQQLVQAMSGADGELAAGARVVQLGDLGHSKHGPGGRGCFQVAKTYLEGFTAPTALVLGNHDLEGEEFETDEENLEAWKQVFQQPHHWTMDLGHVVLVGVSTVRYRSNLHSHHEVHVDEEQMSWLEAELERYKDRPVVMISHAPPIGCGLKVMHNIHIKNRCAWLNHSDRPQRFVQLVQRHPHVRLWFSGHFHLSHNYPDSISVVGRTAYVQTGVIGECNYDGNRHSRVLVTSGAGYEVHTMDHETGRLRLDLQARWDDASPPQPMLPPDEELLCDPSAGWLCSKLSSLELGESNDFIQWYRVGARSILAVQDELLVEYDLATSSPIGLVAKVPSGCEVLLLNAAAQPVLPGGDGEDVTSVTITSSHTGPQVIPRNSEGGFYQIFQPNKWRAKKEAARAAAEAAAAAAH